MSKILFISGSLAPESKTLLLLREAIKKAEDMGFETELFDLRNEKIPFCDGRPIPEYEESLMPIFKTVAKADLIVIGMPIYCYSISGPLKNFIDIFSGAFVNKKFGVCASAGSKRSYLATAELVKILGYECNATGVQPMVLTDHSDYKNGQIIDETIFERIERMLQSLTTCP